MCLVGLAQSFVHYSCIASKLSLNLTALRDSDQLVFIEGLKMIGANIIDHCEEYRTPLNILHENVNLTRDSERKNLKNLYEQIKQSIDTAKKTILLIDDLSVFVSLGYMEADVTIFCHYLRSLLRSSQNGLSIATLIHCSSTLDIENDSLVHDAEYHSDATIFVQPLQTGYSRVRCQRGGRYYSRNL